MFGPPLTNYPSLRLSFRKMQKRKISVDQDYRVALPQVAKLELTLVPDINGSDGRASLRQLRIAG